MEYPVAQKEPLCPLCTAEGNLLFLNSFYLCSTCEGIFRSSNDFLSPKEERIRYTLHNNNPSASGYRKFSLPLVSAITSVIPPGTQGLDFGSGTQSAASSMLCEQGYPTEGYDPFFHNDPALLNKKYNYIFCCEVIEHFQEPGREFLTLFSLLNPGGSLFCMTQLYSSTINFPTWYYKNDPTHVFFYQENTIKWISRHYGFSKYLINDRVIRFDKPNDY